jgi:hypothetical protein
MFLVGPRRHSMAENQAEARPWAVVTVVVLAVILLLGSWALFWLGKR